MRPTTTLKTQVDNTVKNRTGAHPLVLAVMSLIAGTVLLIVAPGSGGVRVLLQIAGVILTFAGVGYMALLVYENWMEHERIIAPPQPTASRDYYSHLLRPVN